MRSSASSSPPRPWPGPVNYWGRWATKSSMATFSGMTSTGDALAGFMSADSEKKRGQKRLAAKAASSPSLICVGVRRPPPESQGEGSTTNGRMDTNEDLPKKPLRRTASRRSPGWYKAPLVRIRVYSFIRGFQRVYFEGPRRSSWALFADFG